MKENNQLPIIIEKGEDGFYIASCPVLEGCFTQGKTIDEAIKNIKEVIDLILEEKEAKKEFKSLRSREISLHNITI